MAGSRVLRRFAIFVTGLALAANLLMLIRTPKTPVLILLLSGLIFFFIGAILASLAVEKIIFPRFVKLLLKIQLVWIGLCLLIGFVLVYFIPFTISSKFHTIQIIATGLKNPSSKGSEVWLASITGNHRTPAAPLSRMCHGNWLSKGDLLVFSQSQPSSLECSFRTDDHSILVSLGTHPWSGKARLIYEEQIIDVDLYAESSGLQEVQFHIPIRPSETWLSGLLFLSHGICLGWLLLSLSTWLGLPNVINKPASTSKSIRWYWYSMPLALIWSLILLAFWPGLLSPDTVYQFQQIASGAINDWHPAFHTLTLWLLTRIWFAPAPVVVVQILFLSTLIGWSLSIIQTLGSPPWLTWGVVVFFVISPGINSMLLTVWKDIAYSLAIVALTLLVLKLLISRGNWIEKPSSWIFFGIVTSLVALYRHNGLLVAFGTLISILFFYHRHWKPILAAAALAGLFWWGVRGPLFQLTGVNTSDEAQGRNLGLEGGAYALINDHSISGTILFPEERELLSRIVDIPSLATYSQDLAELAIHLTLRNPRVTIDYLAGKSTFIFQVLQPPHSRKEYVGLDIYENPFGMKLNSKIPLLQTLYTRYILWSEKPAQDWLFWRNAFWMYLLIFSAAIACIRRRTWHYFLLTFPVLINALPLFAFSGGQLARYILPTLLVSPIFTGYLFLIPPSHDDLNRLE